MMQNPNAPPFPTAELPPEIAFRQAMSDSSVAKIHAGMFALVSMSSEPAMMFGFAGVTTGVVSMPWPLMKTFAKKLNEMVSGYEAVIEQQITSQEEIDAKFNPAALQSKTP